MKPNIYMLGGLWLGKLAIVGRPRGNEWLRDEIDELAKAGIDVVVSLLGHSESLELGLDQEAVIARRSGLRFINFPIPDYGVPASSQQVFDLVLTLDELLSRGQTVAIHCRQGIGRSSLIAACLLSLSNEDIDA